MPSLSLERLLKQLLDVEQHRFGHADQPVEAPVFPLVAMVYDYGSEGEAIGRALAARLGVHFLGDDLSQQPKDSLHLEEILLRRLDEQGRRRHHHTLADFLSGSPTTMPTYRRHLVEALLMIAEREGGVIVDRGAHVFLRDRPVLRVRLIGSPEACARRVAAREGLSHEAALERVETVNRKLKDYLRALLGKDMLDAAQFDLVVNTDRVQEPAAVAEALYHAMHALGLPTAVPRKGKG